MDDFKVGYCFQSRIFSNTNNSRNNAQWYQVWDQVDRREILSTAIDFLPWVGSFVSVAMDEAIDSGYIMETAINVDIARLTYASSPSESNYQALKSFECDIVFYLLSRRIKQKPYCFFPDTQKS